MTARQTQAAVAGRLRLAGGGPVGVAELVDAAFGQRRDGGPVEAARHVHLAARRLRARGFPILATPGRGYRYAAGPPPGDER